MMEAGLTTLSVSQLRPAQQAFLFVLMLLGDIVSGLRRIRQRLIMWIFSSFIAVGRQLDHYIL